MYKGLAVRGQENNLERCRGFQPGGVLSWLQNSQTVFCPTCKKEQALRKHAYSNILKISSPKTENFPIKTSDIFHISAQNIDCGYSLEPPRRGGSNEYPQSMFLSRNKKI